MKFPSTIYNQIHIPEKTAQGLIKIFHREELPKGHILFRKGEICRRIYFIQTGIARVYYTSRQGKE